MGRLPAIRRLAIVLLATGIAACGSTPPSPPERVDRPTATPTQTEPATRPPTTGPSSSAAPVATAAFAATSLPSAWTLIRPASIESAAGAAGTSACMECHGDVNTTMSGIAAGPGGLVAVGWIFQGFHGEVWRSTDGADWAPDAPLAESTALTAVAANADRYVAVGTAGSGAAVWTSADGIAWRRVSSDALADPTLRLDAVVAWPGGFVAAGHSGVPGTPPRAAFVVSADGLAWQRVPDVPSFANSRVAALVAGPAGLVAAGSTITASGGTAAAVWTSADGRRWSAVDGGGAFDGASISALTAVPGGGLVAGGQSESKNRAIIWTSPDGTSWTREPGSPALGGPGEQVQIYGLAAFGSTSVATGLVAEGSDAQYGNATVWVSTDGETWQREESGVEFVAAHLYAVVSWGSRFVGAGDTGAPDDFNATVWISPRGLGR